MIRPTNRSISRRLSMISRPVWVGMISWFWRVLDVGWMTGNKAY
jgi:hypothetical protein